MSLAILRGRGLVIGLLRIVGENDRTLASVGELDARRGQMKRADHRLVGVGAHLGQGALQSFPVDPKRRNGFVIAALQLAPVTKTRDTPAPPCDSPA